MGLKLFTGFMVLCFFVSSSFASQGNNSDKKSNVDRVKSVDSKYTKTKEFKSIVSALIAIESKFEVGVNYKDFESEVQNLNLQVRNFNENYDLPDSNDLRKNLGELMKSFLFANEFWSFGIRNSSSLGNITIGYVNKDGVFEWLNTSNSDSNHVEVKQYTQKLFALYPQLDAPIQDRGIVHFTGSNKSGNKMISYEMANYWIGRDLMSKSKEFRKMYKSQ